MKKRRMFSLVAAAALVAGTMVSAPAMAGQINAGNTSVAQEAINSTNGVVDNATVVFEPGVPVAKGSTIKFTLSGGSFDNSSYDNVSLFKNGGSIGWGLISEDKKTTTVSIKTTDNLASTDVLTLSNNRPDNKTVAIKIPAGSKAGTKVEISSSSTDAPGVAATATVATIKKEFTAFVTPVTSKIDFANAMKQFITGTTSTAKITILNDDTIATKVFSKSQDCDNATESDNATASITVTGNLASVKSAKYNGNVEYTITSADKTNGKFKLTNLNTLICKKSATNPTGADLTLTVNGQDVISPDTKTVEVDLKVPSGNETVIPAGTKAFVWELNATQFYLPLVGYNADTGRQTYIKLQANNNVSNSVDVSAQILTKDGKMTDVGVVGTITSGTPLLITGDELINKVKAKGGTVDGTDGFAVVLTVKAPREDVFGYANIVDPNGAKRVPLQCVYNGGQIVE